MLKTLFALLFMAAVGLCTEARAQSQNQNQNKTEESTDQGQDQTDDWGQPLNQEETDPYQQTVTIDEDTDTDATATEAEGDAGFDSKPAAKIHIYSGKHDGDNVINPDPK